jgi:hypothetical protein
MAGYYRILSGSQKKNDKSILDTINRSAPTQRTSEGYALVLLNVQSLLNNTPGSAPVHPIEPKISLTPKSAILLIGNRQDLSATLINLANGSWPLAGIPIRFYVDSGPNAGLVLGNIPTVTQGMASITYTSIQTGTDHIIASATFYGMAVGMTVTAVVAHSEKYDTGSILWSGGPDLTIPFFSPPLLITKGGKKFYMSEKTQNIGNVIASASVTRYYISANPILDVTTAQVIGERSIPALQPGKSDKINHRVFTHTRESFGRYVLSSRLCGC